MEPFDFLGFTYICGRRRDGKFILLRQTITKRMRDKLREIKATLYRIPRGLPPCPSVSRA